MPLWTTVHDQQRPEQGDLRAVPNPSADEFELWLPKDPGRATIQWFDTQGRLVETIAWPKGIRTAQLHWGDLAPGCYELRVIGQDGAVMTTRSVRE